MSAGTVTWTPNVSATTTVGATGCNSTFFGSATDCQSEVYSTADVNGEVVVAEAFTEACQPGTLAEGPVRAGNAR